jgi:hypothetical protein
MAGPRTGTANIILHPKPGVESDYSIPTLANVVAGDEIIVAAGGWQGVTGAPIASVNDNQANSYGAAINSIVRNTNQHRASLYRTIASASGALTATIAFGDTGNAGTFWAAIVALEGMAATAVIDHDVLQNGNPVTTLTTASVTVPGGIFEAIAIAVGFAVDMGGTFDEPPGNSFTTIVKLESGERVTLMYRVVAAGTYNATVGLSTNSDGPISVIAALETAATGGGGGLVRRSNLRGNLANLAGGLVA